MAQVDINHPPTGGFQNGGWYWDPSANQARQYWNGGFGAPATINNPNQPGYGQPVSQAVQQQSNPAPTNQAPDASAAKTPAQQAQDLIQASVDSYTKQLTDYTSKLSDYDKANPFVFDDVLASQKGQVKQRLDPYYTQTLGDYLKGVDTTKSRSLEDEKNTLSELAKDTDFYTGQNKVALNSAIETSRNGYANSGLYGSGAQLRSEGAATAGSQNTLQDFLRQQDYKKSQTILSTNRLVNEDLPLQTSQFTRNLNQEETYNVDTQANQATLQKQNQNEFARENYAGAPPGVNPLQYSNSLYSLLGGGSSSSPTV